MPALLRKSCELILCIASRYGALFSLSESPLDGDIIWTGADDGPIHITQDGGKNWSEVSKNFPAGAPTYAVVGEIEASHFAKGTAYVVYDNHRREDHRPYVYRTTDFGRSWTSISGDLPGNDSSYVIREDPVNPSLLFVGTEFGVFVTTDQGQHWVKLKNNLPTVAVRAMAIQKRERELLVGTFGRALWLTDIGPLEELNDQVFESPLYLFDMKPGTLFKTRFTYGATIEELNGDMFFRAENPAYGAVISYYIRDGLSGQATLKIQDQGGKIVRMLTGPASAGIHRLNWDLKRELKVSDAEAAKLGVATISEREALDRVAAGDYVVSLEVGGMSRKKNLTVRKEPQGTVLVQVRK